MNVIKMVTMTASVILMLPGVSNAQTLSGKDSDEIVSISRNNELKFKRDYQGKMFSDTMVFKRASESIFGSSVYVTFDVATCSVTNKSILNEVADWNKGQKVLVTGVLDTTMLGTIHLENCKFSMR